MSYPEIGGREPVTVEAIEGETYWWCRCGRSQTQPFCDGSHEVTDFQPLEWTAKRGGQAQFLHMQAHQDAAVLRQQPFAALNALSAPIPVQAAAIEGVRSNSAISDAGTA